MDGLSATSGLALAVGIFAIAFLYSSVGHAGASGYIAVLSLFGMAPTHIKPIALLLNVLVASLAAWRFWRAGHFSWPLFWPLALLSVPCAFLGGYLSLPTMAFRVVLGLTLLFSALRLFVRPGSEEETAPPSLAAALATGAGIGLLSGLTGTGGGIFLSPLMVFLGWARVKTIAAVAALFILVNSVAALLGNVSATRQLPMVALPLALAAAGGGSLGSALGSQRFPQPLVKRLLGGVLVIAGLKLLFA